MNERCMGRMSAVQTRCTIVTRKQCVLIQWMISGTKLISSVRHKVFYCTFWQGTVTFCMLNTFVCVQTYMKRQPWIINFPSRRWKYGLITERYWNTRSTRPFTYKRSYTFIISSASGLYSETFIQHNFPCQKIWHFSYIKKKYIRSNLTF